MSEKRTTKIRKGISRKIQTKQFESLEVSTSYEDSITWETIEERQQKIDNLTKLAYIDFDKTYQMVCDELKVSARSATAHLKEEDGTEKYASLPTDSDKSKKPSAQTDEELGDIFDGI